MAPDRKIKRLRSPALALAAGAALFPYHFASLRAVNPGAAWPLALLALAIAACAFAILFSAIRDFPADRVKGPAIALVVVGAILTAGEFPFVRGNFLAMCGLALTQAFLIVLFCVAAHSVWKSVLAGPDRPDARTLWIAGAVWLAVAAFSALWFLSSQYVWCWDYSVYAAYSRDLAQAIRKSGPIPRDIGLVLNSLKDEYNMVPAAPIAVVEAVLGWNRIWLILSIAFFYVAPALLAGALLLRRLAPVGPQKEFSGGAAILILVLSALIFPVAFFPSLYGMPDIGGVGMVATLLFVAWRRAPSPSVQSGFTSAAPLIVCGGLLFLICVFRRWYVFAVPSLLLLLTVHEFRRQDAGLPISTRLAATIKGMAVLGAFAGLCGFAFYWARLLEMANQNYAGAYIAYANPAAVEFDHAVWHFGLGPLALFALSALYLLFHRSTRLAGLAALLAPILVAALFERVQGFSTQHYLLIVPSMVFAIALAAAHVIATRPQARVFVAGALAICAATAVFGVSFPGANSFVQRTRIVASADLTPPRRDDMSELNRLTRDLAHAAAEREKICVIASGLPLNRTVVRENALTLAPETKALLGDRFIWLGDVDRRDGFMPEFAECDVAVLTTPLLLHLAREEQQSIAWLDAAIKSGAGIGAAFRPTDQTYRLVDGIEARLYRRMAPIAPEDLRGYAEAVTNKPQ